MLRFFAVSIAWPGILNGALLIFAASLYQLVSFKISRRIVRNYCIGMALLLLAIFGQIFVRNESTVIVAMVTDPKLRDIITQGVYSMENGVDIFRVARCLLMISLVTILVNYAKRFNNGRNFIEQTILFLCISFIITLLGANIIGSEIFKSLISIVSSLNTPNYLTQDQYGYRLSGFFHEPSQASIVFGTSLACLAYMRSKIRWFLVLTVLAILYFFMSRSLTILVIFLVCLILLNTPRIFSVIFICTLFGFQTIISVFHNQILPTGLIRSIYERAFASQFEIADWRNFLFGTDFGEVYSFEPIWGIHLQVGYIGLIALYFILQRDVRAYAFAVTCFTIAPHLWFAPSWFALAIFLIGSDRSVRAQLSK